MLPGVGLPRALVAATVITVAQFTSPAVQSQPPVVTWARVSALAVLAPEKIPSTLAADRLLLVEVQLRLPVVPTVRASAAAATILAIQSAAAEVRFPYPEAWSRLPVAGTAPVSGVVVAPPAEILPSAA